MSGKTTAGLGYLFDLEAAEDNNDEEDVDMTEEDMGFINDEGGEDMSSDDADKGRSNRDGAS
jgi:hypothetical protein